MLLRALHWLFPSICPGCGRDVKGVSPVCFTCLASFPVAPSLSAPASVDRFAALSMFESPVRDVVLAFKYRGKGYLGETLAAWMRDRLPAWARSADLFVPVPAPFLRRVARGYHPADVMAVALARRRGLPVERWALRRRHGHPSQTALDRQKRGENAARSYATGLTAGRVNGRRVLLIDDVCTTGATLSVCARLLRSAGAVSVDAVVLAQEALGGRGKPLKMIRVAAVLDEVVG